MSEKPICFVPDTNVWRTRTYLGFQTPVAAALLFALRRQNGWIGLPEVIEIEVVKHLGELAHERSRQYESAKRDLAHLGVVNIAEPPLDEEILSGVGRSILDQLDPVLLRIPFRHKHARNALIRVNEGTPPNGPKNQQFKDSAVWEALHEVCDEYRVVFVTGDKGFFENRDPGSGLAPKLREECVEKSADIDVIYTSQLDRFIATLQEDVPPVNQARILLYVGNEIDDNLKPKAERRGFKLGQRNVQSVGVFVTEEPGRLAITFTFNYPLTGVQEETEGMSGKLITSGSCQLNVDTGKVTDIQYGWQVSRLESSDEDEKLEAWSPFTEHADLLPSQLLMPLPPDA